MGLLDLIKWYFEWALPGMGMFSEAYIVFSAGQIGAFQATAWPTCFKKCSAKFHDCYKDCDAQMVQHLASYIMICGIMAGMLLWGFLADITGRKWGSRLVMVIMLSGCILLTFTPYVDSPYGYFAYFLTAQTWYGFGVGGEYPLASSSAAERAEKNPELQQKRGQQVALVFSNQGMGNLVNASVILICMAIFGQTGATLTADGSKKVLMLTYGVGAICCLATMLYRFIFLKESQMFKEETSKDDELLEGESHKKMAKRHWVSFKHWWPRQVAGSVAWICNDFAFYGNKLQQGIFIGLLFPTATQYKKQQWTVLNNFIALTGYYCGAWLIDKPWYGRRHMQNVGFLAMMTFNFIIYGQWENMGVKGAPEAGVKAFQALYYLSSFFNQFGPNVTTWLVAGEVFPTDIRASYHGFAACMGKLGAIIAALWISYIPQSSQKDVFLISAIWAIGGWLVTWVFLPDTTGLNLQENDEMQRCLLTGAWGGYCGEGVNPKHLSPWEIYVLGWHKKYVPPGVPKSMESGVDEDLPFWKVWMLKCTKTDPSTAEAKARETAKVELADAKLPAVVSTGLTASD